MNSRKKCKAILAFLLASVAAGARPAAAQHEHEGTHQGQVGAVHFPVSCNAAAQQQFERAVAMLHSFWYEEAEKTFTAVTEADPSCAMGFWGVAMSQYHQYWEPPVLPGGLEKGRAAVERAQALDAKTPRERDYISAIATYYRDSDKLESKTRALAYRDAMAQVHRKNPGDNEAAVFYALALISTASPTDKTYANQKEAAKLLNEVLAVEPNHPGVTHYFIHAYDYPALASLALPAARQYSKIAPAVPHALHMPSHIFTRLGLWQESIQSNRASAAAARAYTARSQMAGAWDQQLHAMDYLMYAYLQGAEDRKAKAVLDELSTLQKAQPENLTAGYAFSAIPARYALERRRWSEAASLELRPADFPWSKVPFAAANVSFARALGAARSGKAAEAKKRLAELENLRDALGNSGNKYWADLIEVQRRAAAAWIARAEGKDDEAMQLMRASADLEDSTEKHATTPGSLLPARELLGDLLLELQRPADALREYEASLRNTPERFNGLYGAARSAKLVGDNEKARSYFAKLLQVTKLSDGNRPELAEAKTLLAAR